MDFRFFAMPPPQLKGFCKQAKIFYGIGNRKGKIKK